MHDERGYHSEFVLRYVTIAENSVAATIPVQPYGHTDRLLMCVRRSRQTPGTRYGLNPPVYPGTCDDIMRARGRLAEAISQSVGTRRYHARTGQTRFRHRCSTRSARYCAVVTGPDT